MSCWSLVAGYWLLAIGQRATLEHLHLIFYVGLSAFFVFSLTLFLKGTLHDCGHGFWDDEFGYGGV